MNDFTNRWFVTDDGLQLYARDYSGPPTSGSEIVCLHGLTRNSADFAELAEHLDDNHRVLVVEQRGRGRSSYDSNPDHYAIPTYVADTVGFIDQQGLARPVLIGTSMGGITAMAMARREPGRYQGLILNDIGPVIDPAGLARIEGNVSKRAEVNNWADAEALARANNDAAFPDFTGADWTALARKLFAENAQGVPVLAYDPNIARSVRRAPAEAASDAWQGFDALTDVPMLVIRGAISDILSADTMDEMARRHPRLDTVTVPNRGHAPDLSEPAAVAAIDRFLGALSG